MAVTAYVTHTAPKHPLQTDWHSLVEVEFTNAAQEGQEASQEIEDENLGDAARVRARHRTQNGFVKHLGKPTNPWKSLQGGQCLSTSQHFINMKLIPTTNRTALSHTLKAHSFLTKAASTHLIYLVGLQNPGMEPGWQGMEPQVSIGANGIGWRVLPCLKPLPINEVVCLQQRANT